MAWQVGAVEDTLAGSRFNIIDADTQRPMVTFGYLRSAEAKKARKLIVEALKEAKFFGVHAR
jgi:hypothetical protein